jgi:hypothetical protein
MSDSQVKKIELEPEKISGIFLHIDGKWHAVTEVNVDYDTEIGRAKLEIKYEEVENKKDYRVMANAPVDLIFDLKAFGLSDVKESIFLIELEADRKISWSLTTRKEIEKNPDFAGIRGQ